jgi:hypothetical protein
MKRYQVAVLRERLSEALDAAYQGVPVMIERKGVEYRLTRAYASKKKRTGGQKQLFQVVDSTLMSADWTWDWSPSGMTLSARAPAKKRK